MDENQENSVENSSQGSRSLADVADLEDEEAEEFGGEKQKSASLAEEPEKVDKVEGKRWSDGGYGYGYDCSSRLDESGNFPIASKYKNESEYVIQESSFDYNRMTTGHLCPVAEEVVAVHNRTHVKFVFLRTGRSRLYVPPEDVSSNRGIGVIAGRDDLSVLAWSDIGPPAPKIHVYQYTSPADIKTLQG